MKSGYNVSELLFESRWGWVFRGIKRSSLNFLQWLYFDLKKLNMNLGSKAMKMAFEG